MVNLWIDLPAILAVLAGEALPGHGDWGHTFVGATLVAVIFGVFRIRSWPWVLGAFFGAWSHVLLDALVHLDIRPFYPIQEDNPLYLGIMEPLSWALTPLTVWFIAQAVSSSLTMAQKFFRRAGRPNGL